MRHILRELQPTVDNDDAVKRDLDRLKNWSLGRRDRSEDGSGRD